MAPHGHPIVLTALSLLSAGRVREVRVPWKWFFISNGAILLLYYLHPASSLLMRIFRWGRQFLGALNPRLDLLIAGGEKELRIGAYSAAEKSLAFAAAEAKRRGAPASKQATILRNVAEAQRSQGDWARAEQTIRQAMALISGNTGEGRTQYADCLEALADVCRDRGNYVQTQTLLQESLSMEESLPSPNPALLAKRRQKLALSYRDAGEHAAAALQFVRSLEAHEAAFGPEHSETGRMLTEAGAALHQARDHAAALRHLTRALQIHEKALGADAPEVAQNLYCQALVYEDSGNLDQAAAQYERLLLLRSRQVAGNELELAEVLFYLSRVCLALGRLARAEEMARSAILIMEPRPGPELATTLELLAKIYERSDRQPEAASANERARLIWNSERHALRQRSGLVFSRATTPFASRSS